MALSAIALFDIDGVIRDVGGSYRRALADTVAHFTSQAYRPTQADIDTLKGEGCWNNDWEASQELIYRYFEQQGEARSQIQLDYDALIDFFQQRYRGPELDDPKQRTGYIAQEPVLVQADYFNRLTNAGIHWGFFSGATRGSARYVLEHRLGLSNPPLVAMEDAPGKPDPTGLLQIADRLMAAAATAAAMPVVYAGDTVADMQTLQHAQQQRPQGRYVGVGILPPHVLAAGEVYAQQYAARLQAAGAAIVLASVNDLIPATIIDLVSRP